VAVWTFGNYAARRQRDNADQQLAGALGAASAVYRNTLDEAGQRARKTASSRRVQRAFLKGRESELRRIQRTKRNVVLTRKPSGARIPPNAGTRTVEVLSGNRRIGRVIAFVPLDRRLPARLTQAANGQRLALEHDGVLTGQNGSVRLQSRRPLAGTRDLLVGGSRYRVVATRLGESKRSTLALVALKRSSAIAGQANAARWRVMAVGFALIAALLTIAYAVSPTIARSRVSRQERDQAERVLAHVGDGIFLVDHEGVIRLWNPAAEAITGLRADAIRGLPAQETIPGWTAITAIVPVAPKPGGAHEEMSAETVPLDIAGKEIWLSIVGVALADGTVYAFRDVTRERPSPTSSAPRLPPCTEPR
jgi:PAS domain S-box-containing protein